MTTTTNVAVYNDEAKIAEVIASHQPKTKSFNPLENTIQTNEVMDKTLTNYIKQIKTNMYIGKKAMYFIARDAFDAKANLPHEDFVRLVETFGWNASTQSKFLSIGGSDQLFKIYKEGRLPSNWTTLYQLSILTDAQFNKVNKLLEPDVSWNKIAKELGIKNLVDPNWILNFLNLEVDTRELTVADFAKTLSNIKNDLKKYKAITVKEKEDDKEAVERKINKYLNSLKNKKDKEVKKRENKRKGKEIQTQVAA
jgi:hypothetical protein